MAARENLLVVNAGSSSIKLAVFDAALGPVLTADATGISDKSGTGTLRFGSDQAAARLPDHATALNHLMAGLSQKVFRQIPFRQQATGSYTAGQIWCPRFKSRTQHLPKSRPALISLHCTIHIV